MALEFYYDGAYQVSSTDAPVCACPTMAKYGFIELFIRTSSTDGGVCATNLTISVLPENNVIKLLFVNILLLLFSKLFNY